MELITLSIYNQLGKKEPKLNLFSIQEKKNTSSKQVHFACGFDLWALAVILIFDLLNF